MQSVAIPDLVNVVAEALAHKVSAWTVPSLAMRHLQEDKYGLKIMHLTTQ